MDDRAQDGDEAAIVGARVTLLLAPVSLLEAIADAQAAAPEGAEPAAVEWVGVGVLAPDLVESAPAGRRMRQVAEEPSTRPWLVRIVVVDDPASPTGRRIVGHLGGHGAPNDRGMVEIGYTLSAPDRGQGFATEAARAWFAWAYERGGTVARICTLPTNAPSLAIAHRLGLVEVGREWDEDDEVWEVVLEAPLPLAPPD